MHKKALENIESKLEEVLKNVVITKHEHLEMPKISLPAQTSDLAAAIKKEKRPHINNLSDVFVILYDQVRNNLPEKSYGQLSSVLKQNKMKELKQQIIEIILSIPKKYTCLFPLSQGRNQHIDLLKIADGVSITKLKSNSLYLTVAKERDYLSPYNIFDKTKQYFQKDELYLSIETVGFAVKSIDESAISSAISLFKQTMYLGYLLGIISFDESVVFWSRDNELKFYCIENGTDSANLIRLNIEFENKIKNAVVKTMDDKPKTKLKLGVLKEVLMAKCDDENFKSIKAALEWAFDSYFTKNQTLSFIQLCMGLEALLGEDYDSKQPLVSQLADRCAYLIGDTSVVRKAIRKDFKDLYDKRSALVHGRELKIDADDSYRLLSRGRSYLDQIVKRELDYTTLGNINFL